MNFDDLINALVVDGQHSLTIAQGSLGAAVDTLINTCFANRYNNNQPAIVIRDANITKEVATIKVTGKSEFLQTSLGDTGTSLDVTGTFSLDDKGEVQLVLRYALSDGLPGSNNWKFSNSFACLPPFTDWTKPVNESAIQLLDELCLSDSAFVVTTQNQTDPLADVPLEPGINFVSQLEPQGVLGLLTSIFGQESALAVYGRIVLPQEGESIEPREPFDSPWATGSLDAFPGILLTVQLTKINLGESAFDDFCLRIYCPIDAEWLEQNPTHMPLCSFTGELTISERVKIKLIADYEVGANDVYLAGIGQGLSISNLSDMLSISGPGDHYSALPADLESLVKGLSQIELQRVGLGLSIESFPPKITSCMFAIGLSSIDWSIWEGHFALTALSCQFEVDNPFDSDTREMVVTLTAITEIEGIKVDIFASSREEFTFYASLANVDIPIKALLQSFNLDFTPPSDLHIDSLRVGIAPMKSYSFALFMAGKPNAWMINLGSKTLEISDVTLSLEYPKGGPVTGLFGGTLAIDDIGSFSCRYDLREFSASTGPGQALGMGLFIVWLNDLFGTGTEVPAAISSLTLDDLSLAFSTGTAGQFAFKGNSSLEVDGTPVKISFDIDVTGTEKKIGAQLTIGGEQFAVSFDDKKASAGDEQDQDYETALIALYEHAAGPGAPPEPNLRDMVAALSSDLSQAVPAIQINKAIFGYHSSRQNTESKSAWLFGIELGAMNFSISGPDQTVISALIGSDLNFGIDSPQLLLTTQALKHEVLAQLPSLGKKFKLPAADLNAACFSGSLKLGGQEYPLMLNLGEEQKGNEQEKSPSEEASSENRKLTPPDSSLAPQKQTAAAAAPVSDVKWIKVQKQVSGLYFEKIGLRYKSGTLGLLLSASLTASGLTISLDGFSIESPLDQFQPRFDLSGLGISYKADPLEISGAFLKMSKNEYGGAAILKTKKFSLSAIGTYAYQDGHPSMFIYAFLDYPLGGPPVFYVTGLAAGFGYNRTLLMPNIDQVAEFPLIEEVTKGESTSTKPDLAEELRKLDEYVRVQTGQYFLVAGVKFTSFKMMESFAMLAVSFGQYLEIEILGLSTIKIPFSKDNPCLSEIKVAFKASYIPDDGILKVIAQLTSDSYILSKDNHPTGGLAFYSWFAGEHAGDFVLSVGGYHSKFNVPAHYPQVPRLALSWQVTPQLSIKGNGYFALTPSVLMAGGNLEACWHSGPLEAWFKAQVDFLIAWKPFHYDATMYVNMGIAYTFSINTWFGSWTKRLTAELGTDLHIWGPDFSGIARIKVSFISFSIAFGAGASQIPGPIEWEEFKSSFLPDDILTISVRNGLISRANEDKPANGDIDLGVIDPKDFSLVVDSAIPVKKLNGDPAKYKLDGKEVDGTSFGVAPMDLKDLESNLVIKIQRLDGDNPDDCTRDFQIMSIPKNVPAGLWGTNFNPELNSDPMVKDVISGFEITVKPIAESLVSALSAEPTHVAAAMMLESQGVSMTHVAAESGIQEIVYSQPIPKEQELDLQWEQDLLVSTDLQVDPINIIQDSLKTANGRRQEMLAALGFESDVITIKDSLAEAFVAAPQIEG